MTEKWDLSDIFASSNDALVESKKVLSEYQAFRKKYAGKVASLKPMYLHGGRDYEIIIPLLANAKATP